MLLIETLLKYLSYTFFKIEIYFVLFNIYLNSIKFKTRNNSFSILFKDFIPKNLILKYFFVKISKRRAINSRKKLSFKDKLILTKPVNDKLSHGKFLRPIGSKLVSLHFGEALVQYQKFLNLQFIHWRYLYGFKRSMLDLNISVEAHGRLYIKPTNAGQFLPISSWHPIFGFIYRNLNSKSCEKQIWSVHLSWRTSCKMTW